MYYEKLILELKKNKVIYYLKNFLRLLIPSFFYQRKLKKELSRIINYNLIEIQNRVDYCNKLSEIKIINSNATELNELVILKSPKAYGFDLYEYARYFKNDLLVNFLVGDINYLPEYPSVLKSRPISINNQNAILLKLDKKRHFNFISDKVDFNNKKNILIGRGSMTQQHRIKFMEMYFGHNKCDLGHVGKNPYNAKWLKPKLSILDHLQYKFILSLEGNDVATNLKWIMSSNSIAVMPKPKFETWFMEGKLIADYHYLEIKDDYSDLELKLNYYIKHTEEAEAIVKNANNYILQFLDKRKEDLISILVLEKYFKFTSQK